jgi:hypothetical protein
MNIAEFVNPDPVAELALNLRVGPQTILAQQMNIRVGRQINFVDIQ